eukprot:scaffold116473_cov25-Prasinocladus_malaysianus.AAC.1
MSGHFDDLIFVLRQRDCAVCMYSATATDLHKALTPSESTLSVSEIRMIHGDEIWRLAYILQDEVKVAVCMSRPEQTILGRSPPGQSRRPIRRAH